MIYSFSEINNRLNNINFALSRNVYKYRAYIGNSELADAISKSIKRRSNHYKNCKIRNRYLYSTSYQLIHELCKSDTSDYKVEKFISFKGKWEEFQNKKCYVLYKVNGKGFHNKFIAYDTLKQAIDDRLDTLKLMHPNDKYIVEEDII